MVWYSIRPAELQDDDFDLYIDIRNLVVEKQLQLHPENIFPSQYFVLRADSDYLDSTYIHVGDFTPNADERFTLRLLRWHIGNGGAGVKPRGVAAGYQQGHFTEAQDAVMERALDYMAAKSQAMAEGGGGWHQPHQLMGAGDLAVFQQMAHGMWLEDMLDMVGGGEGDEEEEEQEMEAGDEEGMEDDDEEEDESDMEDDDEEEDESDMEDNGDEDEAQALGEVHENVLNNNAAVVVMPHGGA